MIDCQIFNVDCSLFRSSDSQQFYLHFVRLTNRKAERLSQCCCNGLFTVKPHASSYSLLFTSHPFEQSQDEI